MDPNAKLAVTSNILQIEESYRDAVIAAQEQRYRKLREIVSRMMTTEVIAVQEEKL